MITHESVLHALNHQGVRDHFDSLARLVIGTGNAWCYSPERITHFLAVRLAFWEGLFPEDLENCVRVKPVVRDNDAMQEVLAL